MNLIKSYFCRLTLELLKIDVSKNVLIKEDVLGIGDVGEEEGVARNALTSGTTVFLLDNVAELVDGQSAAPYINHRADNGPNHVAKETVGRDGKTYRPSPKPLPREGSRHTIRLAHETPLPWEGKGGGSPLCLHDAAVVGLDVSMEFGEGGEVGVVEETLAGFVHKVEVERLMEVPGIMAQEG